MDILKALKPTAAVAVTPIDLSVEKMLVDLRQYGETNLMSMSRGGWWAYMECKQGAATLSIKGESGLPTPYDAVLDLYRKAHAVLRIKS